MKAVVRRESGRQLHARMAAVKGKHTRPEMAIRSLIHRLGYRFRLHDKSLPGCPDIILSKHRCIVFVNGCFWHQHPRCPRAKLPTQNAAFWTAKLRRNRERDLDNVKKLRCDGWRVAVVWECETSSQKLDALAWRLIDLIEAS